MQKLLANQIASISELKKNPSKLISEAKGSPIVILNHNTAAAYLVPADTYESILELLDNRALEKLAKQRLSDGKKPIKVGLDDL